MKVALLVPGGVDRSGTHRVIPFMLALIERLAREVDLHVFALRQEERPGRWRLLGAQIHNVGAAPRGMRAAMAVAAEHRRGRFDVLHSIWATPGAPAAVLGALLGRPVLLHLLGGDLTAAPAADFGLLRSARGRAILRIALAGADRITTPSRPMIEAAARLGVHAERLVLGVDRTRWPAAPPRRRNLEAPARLLHVASLNPVKDQPTLLRALHRLLEGGVSAHLDVVGEDTLGGAVQRLAADLGLAHAVTFHGFLTQTELRPLMDRAHALVVSSVHESDPIVLLEAALAGVPTVGTAVGHLVDWAPDAAVAVPVGDAPALARGIAALLGDETRRLEVARAAQARGIAEDADWSAARVLEIYRELAASAG